MQLLCEDAVNCRPSRSASPTAVQTAVQTIARVAGPGEATRQALRGSLLAGLFLCLAQAAWSQTIPLDDADEGEETITLPDDGQRLVFRNRSGGEVTFYGQFNPTWQSFDDGGETTSGVVDNGNWNSRVGFRIVQPLDNATLRLRFETGLGLRNSAQISQTQTPPWIDWQRTSLRWFEAAFDTGYGTFSFGQGSTAADGTAGLDSSFTFVISPTDASDGFGSFQFRDDSGVLTGVTVGQVNSSFNVARLFRARYDTPDHSGFVLSTSYGINILNENDDSDYADLAVRWSGDLGDVSVETALGYGWQNNPDAPDQERVLGSATAYHDPTGLNLNVAAGSRIDGPQYGYIKAGWRADFVPQGKTSLFVDYYRGEDFLTDGAVTETYGLGAVQSFDDLSLDVYAALLRFAYEDGSSVRYQDATGVLFGARWFF
jgi:hypothetical protein